MLTHDPVAVEAALQFWAASLGVDEERLETGGVTVVPNETRLPLRGVVILRRRDACVLSILHPDPRMVIDKVMAIGSSHSPVELLTPGPWAGIAAGFVPEATIFASSTSRIPPLPKRGARNLVGSDDLMRVGRLMDRADAAEWEAGGVDPRGSHLAGVFDGEGLVAVASLEKASEQLGIARIFVAPSHRRRGLASSLLSHLASQHTTTFCAIQLAAAKGHTEAEGLALGLGFFPFGETASVALE